MAKGSDYLALSQEEEPTILVEKVTVTFDGPHPHEADNNNNRSHPVHTNGANVANHLQSPPKTKDGSSRSVLCRLPCLVILFCSITALFLVFKMNCLGDGACEGNTGKIGFGACNGDKACRFNTGNVALFSCNGDSSCAGNTAVVMAGSCNGDGACAGNKHYVEPGTCNGDNACTSHE